ncbi:MAG TPA: glycine cleavage system aminomethyltransferase GcvT [Hyphomicrobiales bacterium]|nr:glycine cleavage system aminomethyltransferase GcvT [Hyphomicrobiales bacterium]
MNLRTPLYEQHLAAGARMVDFAGWDMPLHYGSQLAEHRQVREHAGVFDVSHMGIIDITGAEALPFLRRVLSRDPVKLQAGGALYSALLNQKGGVLDDVIVYRLQDRFRLIGNCATRAKDLAWLQQHAQDFAVTLQPREDLAILAVHGPASLDAVCGLVDADTAAALGALKYFQAFETGDFLYARTGYTGELGLELLFPAEHAAALWNRLLAAGVKPIGLGARDSLRLEAGMNLYGHDMTEDTSPLVANMGQVISWEPAERDFIGRAAAQRDRELQTRGELPCLTGLVFEGRGVLREGQQLQTDAGPGLITSGGFSPTLNHSIALARIPMAATTCQVELRGTLQPVRIVTPPFVRHGKKVFE